MLRRRTSGWGIAHWSTLFGCLASAATVAALFLPPKGQGRGERPRPAEPQASARHALMQYYAGEWEAMWDRLYPPDRKLVSRQRYARCESRGGTVPLRSLQFEGVGGEMSGRPDLHRAISIVHFIAHAGDGLPSEHIDFGMVRSGKTWFWLLDDESYRAYRSGRCPEFEPVEPDAGRHDHDQR